MTNQDTLVAGARARVEGVRGFWPSRTGFEQLRGADLWHLSVRLPRDSRMPYNFVVHSAVSIDGVDRVVETYPLDPLNPAEFDGGSGSAWSER